MDVSRVVSLLPSASETLAFIGGPRLLQGRSHECDYPESIKNLPVLTSAVNQFVSSRQMHDAVTESLQNGRGLYHIHSDLLVGLQPQVVLTQSLCSVCSIDLEVVERVVARSSLDPKPKIVSLNPQCIEDVIHECEIIGAAVGLEKEGHAAAEGLRARMEAGKKLVKEMGPSKNGKVLMHECLLGHGAGCRALAHAL